MNNSLVIVIGWWQIAALVVYGVFAYFVNKAQFSADLKRRRKLNEEADASYRAIIERSRREAPMVLVDDDE